MALNAISHIDFLGRHGQIQAMVTFQDAPDFIDEPVRIGEMFQDLITIYRVEEIVLKRKRFLTHIHAKDLRESVGFRLLYNVYSRIDAVHIVSPRGERL